MFKMDLGFREKVYKDNRDIAATPIILRRFLFTFLLQLDRISLFRKTLDTYMICPVMVSGYFICTFMVYL